MNKIIKILQYTGLIGSLTIIAYWGYGFIINHTISFLLLIVFFILLLTSCVMESENKYNKRL